MQLVKLFSSLLFMHILFYSVKKKSNYASRQDHIQARDMSLSGVRRLTPRGQTLRSCALTEQVSSFSRSPNPGPARSSPDMRTFEMWTVGKGSRVESVQNHGPEVVGEGETREPD